MRTFQQWLTETSYSRQVELSFVDCDRDRNVRPSKLMSLMAAVAGFDYDARGLPYEKLYGLGQAFLLSRIAIRIHRRPVNGDVLTVTTWENGIRGAHLRRLYEMTDENGSLCVSGKSDWILVNPLNRRILNPNSCTVKTFMSDSKEVDCPECRKILLPREGIENLSPRPIRWSDLDGNGHVHSGNYGDMIWDALPSDLQGAPLKDLYINYNKEAVLGETLTLLGSREAGAYSVEGLVGEARCFSCRCEFEE